MKEILILGAGFGGLETATGLAAALDDRYSITLVDRSDAFFIGFSKIEVLFGRASRREVSYRYEHLRSERVRFVRGAITEIDVAARVVRTAEHDLAYDYLVVALGADLDPGATPGFVESGGHEFYSMAGAEALAPVLADFERGRLVLGILGMPYKCPPAPYEIACQLDGFYRAAGTRDDIELAMVIPRPRPVPNPEVADLLEERLAAHGVELLADHRIDSVDAGARRLITTSGAVDFDVFIAVPVHVPPPVVARSRLSDGGFVPVDRATLETAVPGVYAIGDVTSIPVGETAVPKAGAFAEDAARTVVAEILSKEGFAAKRVPYAARGTCYFDLGDGTVGRVDADYLGGETPGSTLAGPSHELHADKERFVVSRRDRWFRVPGS